MYNDDKEDTEGSKIIWMIMMITSMDIIDNVTIYWFLINAEDIDDDSNKGFYYNDDIYIDNNNRDIENDANNNNNKMVEIPCISFFHLMQIRNFYLCLDLILTLDYPP